MTLRTLHLFAGIGGGHLAGEILGLRDVGITCEWDPESATDEADKANGIGKRPSKIPPKKAKDRPAWLAKWAEYNSKVKKAGEKWTRVFGQAAGAVPRGKALWRQGILMDSFGDKIHGDVTTFRPADYGLVGKVDVVAGGSPCQNFSTAGVMHGVREGLEGAKSGLFYQQLRVAREAKAPIIFWENVGGVTKVHEKQAFDEVLRAIRAEGYETVWGIVGAMHVGAPQWRKRVWVFAWKRGTNLSQLLAPWLRGMPAANADPDEVGTWAIRIVNEHAKHTKHEGWRGSQWFWPAPRNAPRLDWEPVPIVPAKAVVSRVERIKGIGNAWCPQQGAFAFLLCAHAAVSGFVSRDSKSPSFKLPIGHYEYVSVANGGTGEWLKTSTSGERWNWGTVLSAMWKGGGDLLKPGAKTRAEKGWLDTQLQVALNIRTGYLNPQWAEALMGFPPTLLEVAGGDEGGDEDEGDDESPED